MVEIYVIVEDEHGGEEEVGVEVDDLDYCFHPAEPDVGEPYDFIIKADMHVGGLDYIAKELGRLPFTTAEVAKIHTEVYVKITERGY